MGNVSTLGLDLGKTVIQAHGVDEEGVVTVRRALRRGQVLAFFAKGLKTQNRAPPGPPLERPGDAVVGVKAREAAASCDGARGRSPAREDESGGHMPRDFILDPELFPFKFNDAEIVGMRPVDFFVDCVFDGRVLGAQRRDTLICCHQDLQ